jgi:hypothetical protein
VWQQGLTAFGAVNEMDQNLGQGLGHGFSRRLPHPFRVQNG